jgi:hypothetical protein
MPANHAKHRSLLRRAVSAYFDEARGKKFSSTHHASHPSGTAERRPRAKGHGSSGALKRDAAGLVTGAARSPASDAIAPLSSLASRYDENIMQKIPTPAGINTETRRQDCGSAIHAAVGHRPDQDRQPPGLECPRPNSYGLFEGPRPR